MKAKLFAFFLAVTIGTGCMIPTAMAMTDDGPVGEGTVLYDQVVYPMLMPGATDETLILRWMARGDQPVDVWYGAADENGKATGEFTVITAETVPSRFFTAMRRNCFYSAELPVGSAGRFLYGLAESGGQTDYYYCVAPENDEVLHAVFSSDSHISNAKHAARF